MGWCTKGQGHHSASLLKEDPHPPSLHLAPQHGCCLFSRVVFNRGVNEHLKVTPQAPAEKLAQASRQEPSQGMPQRNLCARSFAGIFPEDGCGAQK